MESKNIFNHPSDKSFYEMNIRMGGPEYDQENSMKD